MSSMYRYQIPVDDLRHTVALTSAPLHVASRTHGVVEFWAEHDPATEAQDRTFIVIGTGHRVPPFGLYVGTALAAHGLVWHLYQVPA